MQTQMSHIKNGENTSCCQHENQNNHVLTRTTHGSDQVLWFSLKKHLGQRDLRGVPLALSHFNNLKAPRPCLQRLWPIISTMQHNSQVTEMTQLDSILNKLRIVGHTLQFWSVCVAFPWYRPSEHEHQISCKWFLCLANIKTVLLFEAQCKNLAASATLLYYWTIPLLFIT